MVVSFHPRARDEVEDAQAWYEERSLMAAAGFLHEISVAIRRIGEAPTRYPVSLHSTRRVVLERFPFGIHYRVNENDTSLWLLPTRSDGQGIGQVDSTRSNRGLP